jgi:hypothetical protein
MSDHIPHKFIPYSNVELVYAYVKTLLDKNKIILQKTVVNGEIVTDKEVPDNIKSDIEQYASAKGVSIKFVTK